jgi:1,4-alpha-glucan branching enzyme
MYESFGARPDGRRVTFSLFLPDSRKDPSQYVRGGLPRINRVHVRGTFQSEIGGVDWALDPNLEMTDAGDHPNGQLFRLALDRDLPEGYYEYKYFVEFENETTRWVSDPVSRYGGSDENGNSAFVIGGNRTSVQPIARRLPPRDLILYEMHIDDFTAEYRANRAPVDAVRDRLDYLQDLGVNAIEFMPWTAWAGLGFSWGYDPVQFFSVEYRYLNDAAAPADKLVKLGQLINDMHQRGMHGLGRRVQSRAGR